MRLSIILRAITTSWISVIASAAVGFLLTPYVLHRLGDEAFGLWILVTTLSGYYGFFDAGIRSAVLRYVSRYSAVADKEDVNRVITTAFYFYLIGSFLSVLITFVLVPYLPSFFSIHRETTGAFQSLFIFAGVVQAITFPLIVFAGVLEAAARYDQVYVVQIASLIVRVVLVIGALHLGGGLFAVGAAVIVSNLLAYIIQIPLAIRAVGGFSLRPRWLSKSIFVDMLRYGSVSFIAGTGEKLRSYIWPLEIARFISPVAVTIFSIPTKLLSFPTSGLATMTEIVNPISSQLEAKQDFSKLRVIIRLSVQSAFLILTPMIVFLILYGRELLTLWVGARYAIAYPLLVLLSLGTGSAATQCCVQSMLFGIQRHKGIMWFRVGEGLATAIVGAVAMKFWGLMGFAWVIAITLLVTSVILVPLHLCRILNLRLGDYLLQGILKPCLAALPMAAALAGLRSVVVVHTWPSLILVLAIGCISYALTLVVFLLGRHLFPIFPSVLSLAVLDVAEEKFLRANRWFRVLSFSRAIRAEESGSGV